MFGRFSACLIPQLLLASHVLAACPATPDRSEDVTAILSDIRAAPDEATAQVIGFGLWDIWAEAPNTRAQEILDRGMNHRASQEFDAALAAFDALIAYCPDYAEGYNQRAFVNFIRRDYASALPDLEKAVELNPIHVAAMVGQALALLQLGRMEAGQAVLRRAVELNPWLPERRMLIEAPGEDL